MSLGGRGAVTGKNYGTQPASGPVSPSDGQCDVPDDARRPSRPGTCDGVRVRHIIIGTGAVGGVIGGLLAGAGKDVVLVARGRQLEALRTDGLEVTTAAGAVRVHPPVAAGPQDVDLRSDDVLVLAVKSQDTATALRAWADRPVAGGGTAAERLPVVCAQNGVDNERAALRRFASVVAMCVWLPATFLEPGRVSAGGTPVPGVLTSDPSRPSPTPTSSPPTRATSPTPASAHP